MEKQVKKPNINRDTHPIAIGDYYIATNAINRLYNYVQNRLPGAIIYGYPRIGKTGAIRYLIRIIQEDLGKDFPVFHLTAKARKIPNETAFFEDLLLGVKHDLALVGSRPNSKRSRLVNFLIEKSSTEFE